MVEDVEEGVLSMILADKFLHVVHDEHIDALVEMHEVIEGVVLASIGKLHHEKMSAQIKDALLGMKLLGTQADGVHQVRLADTTWAINKEGIESHLLRMLGNRLTYTSWQLVASTLNEVAKTLVNIQLRVEVFWQTYSLSQRRRLICRETARSSLLDHIAVALLTDCHIISNLYFVQQCNI